MILRLEQETDRPKVEQLTREAFWNVHVPGCDEHYLAHMLRIAPAFVAELDFVAEIESEIAGNIMYARACIHTVQDGDREVLTFGPVSVLPPLQGKGIGSALIRHTLALALQMGFPVVVIYGDPAYYSRFGFVAAEQYGIRSNEEWFSPALQVLELVPSSLQGISGRFDEGEAYHLDPQAAAEYDKLFPPREKLETPSQQRYRELLSQSHK